MNVGDQVTWIGTKGLFRQPVRIVAVRQAYLSILGQSPEDGETVYDIDARPRIKGTVYAIPANQLEA